MTTELERFEIAVFCPVEKRVVEFLYVRVDAKPDLLWCQGCFLVTEMGGDGCLRCPKSGLAAPPVRPE